MEDGWRCTTLCGDFVLLFCLQEIQISLCYWPLAKRPPGLPCVQVLIFFAACVYCLYSRQYSKSQRYNLFLIFFLYLKDSSRRNAEPLSWFLKVENAAFSLYLQGFALSSECDRLLSIPWSKHSSLIDRRHKFSGIRSILISYLGLGIICCRPCRLLLELCIGRQEG